MLLLVLNKINHFETYEFINFVNATVNLSVKSKNRINVNQLQKIVNDFQPDIIHSHLFAAEIVSRSLYYPKVKWFSHFHNKVPQFQNLRWQSLFKKNDLTAFFEKKHLLNRYKVNGGNHFISISQDTTKFINKVVSNDFQIFELNNAINFNKFHTNNKRTYTAKLRIINVGSFQKLKNQKLLVSIANILNEKNIDFEIIFLGQGEEFNNVKRLVCIYRLENNIQFLGLVNNVEKYLEKSDLYVHTAYSEAFGLVLVEAMAAGLPVITLDGKGNRDIIEEGKNGYMIFEQDAEKFAETIINLWNDKQKMKEISAFANEFAKQYDIVNYVDKLLELYQNAINSK